MEATNDLGILVQDIVTDDNLSKDEKVEALYGLYHHAKAERHGAAESPMIDDEGLYDSLRNIEKALTDLGERPPLNDNRVATP